MTLSKNCIQNPNRAIFSGEICLHIFGRTLHANGAPRIHCCVCCFITDLGQLRTNKIFTMSNEPERHWKREKQSIPGYLSGILLYGQNKREIPKTTTNYMKSEFFFAHVDRKKGESRAKRVSPEKREIFCFFFFNIEKCLNFHTISIEEILNFRIQNNNGQSRFFLDLPGLTAWSVLSASFPCFEPTSATLSQSCRRNEAGR